MGFRGGREEVQDVDHGSEKRQDYTQVWNGWQTDGGEKKAHTLPHFTHIIGHLEKASGARAYNRRILWSPSDSRATTSFRICRGTISLSFLLSLSSACRVVRLQITAIIGEGPVSQSGGSRRRHQVGSSKVKASEISLYGIEGVVAERSALQWRRAKLFSSLALRCRERQMPGVFARCCCTRAHRFSNNVLCSFSTPRAACGDCDCVNRTEK